MPFIVNCCYFYKLCSTFFHGHSFRIGAATSTALTGMPDHTIKIKMLGRWESSAYALYVQIPAEELASVSEAEYNPHYITRHNLLVSNLHPSMYVYPTLYRSRLSSRLYFLFCFCFGFADNLRRHLHIAHTITWAEPILTCGQSTLYMGPGPCPSYGSAHLWVSSGLLSVTPT